MIWILLLGAAVTADGQKSRVLSVFQLIETGKYEDAKEAIELAVWNDKTSRWPRTYYAKGMLCQKAFESGFAKNETKKTNLYPDQLFMAYDSYEKALELDSRKKIHSLIEIQYYSLANSFLKLGERHYQKGEYSKAMKAFEHALLISKSPLVSVETDTSLVYNTAMAAYESKNWEKAISYLSGLQEDGYSPNTALLLQKAYEESGDSASAENVLMEGVEQYNYNQEIVLELVDLFVGNSRVEEAITLLNSAVEQDPENHLFPWTRGLLHLQQEEYERGIKDLTLANEMQPAEALITYNLGIGYYNMGVEISEASRHIRNNSEYQKARQDARNNFQQAVVWLEKAYESDPGHQPTISKLQQLYHRLQMTEKERTMELLLR